MKRLEGKRILVTGAAGGLGGAIVARLAAEGAAVVATDRDASALEALRDGSATPTTAIVADLLSESSIQKLAAAAAAGGTIDGLVNCAGMYPVTALDDLSAAEWDEVLGLNLRAPFLLTKALVPAMRGRDGAVVNISSTASVLARPGIAHYGASKAGLSQLTRVLAVELAPHRIRVNAVLPGVIATERVLAAASGPAAEAEMKAKVARIPLRRLGEAREVAPLVAYLLSDEASYVTGALMVVDGGFSLGIASYAN
jgi:NAD(P)-dependent dehydrogenase (short-subunit alcohol dehydrogenase family)